MLYFRELVNFISVSEPIFIANTPQKSKEIPAMRYFCIESKNYLRELYNPLICALSIMKNDSEVFSFIVRMIGKKKGLNESRLWLLANDIVLFLLADFTSPENYATHCVTLFKPLIGVKLTLSLGNLH